MDCNKIKINLHVKDVILSLTFCIVFTCFYLSFCSALSRTDSLLHVLKMEEKDTTKVDLMLKLCDEYRRKGELSNARAYCDSAMNLSISAGFLKGQGNAHAHSGLIFYSDGNYEKAMESQLKALEIAAAINNKAGSMMCYNSIGNIYSKQGNYNRALEYYIKTLRLSESLRDTQNIAFAYNNIGSVYFHQGIYEKAVENYLASLKIKEEAGDKRGALSTRNNIGSIYFKQGNYQHALKNYTAVLKASEEISDKGSMAASYNNIGLVYSAQNNFDKAILNFINALSIYQELGNKRGIADVYNNAGRVYSQKAGSEAKTGKKTAVVESYYKKALDNFFASLRIGEETGDKSRVISAYLNIADIYTQQKNFPDAEKMLQKALDLSEEIGDKERKQRSYLFLSELYEAEGNFKGGLKLYKLSAQTKDSILNEQSNNQVARLQTIYETEKKEKEIELLQKDKVIAEGEIKKQNTQKLAFAGGFLFAILLAVIVYRGYRQKKKANLLLAHQKQQIEIKNTHLEKANDEITKQKSEIEKQRDIVQMQAFELNYKNEQLTQSITYAKRIQRQIMPHISVIWEAIPRCFVLYKPKDIVSGDFYWFHQSLRINGKGEEEGMVFIGAADCTGHGVPGALMSMVCANKLNDAVNHSMDPGQILALVSRGVKQLLKQDRNRVLPGISSSGKVHDGMDIALAGLEYCPGSFPILHYAGANRPLWLINPQRSHWPESFLPFGEGLNGVGEIKPTKRAIGGHTEDHTVFDKHSIRLQPGDTFYLFSDGYADQDGGDKGKKLMTKNFKKMLLEIQDKSMREQKQYLESFIDAWRSSREQLDDILVIGIRV